MYKLTVWWLEPKKIAIYSILMTNIIISNLDDEIKSRLQKRAEKHGRSLEEEAKEILYLVLAENHEPPLNLATLIEQRFANFEDFELPEILYGIALLPGGKRRDELSQAAQLMFSEDFAGRVLPLDQLAAVRGFNRVFASVPYIFAKLGCSQELGTSIFYSALSTQHFFKLGKADRFFI
ncbi:MAG: hypothetical protein KME59_07525 [Trichormus sp. ATA11-4-KO1]|jgi:plasmid stability protein|nr:hypothetical protein [Trichormus sp. ATA11-4-KO1]